MAFIALGLHRRGHNRHAAFEVGGRRRVLVGFEVQRGQQSAAIGVQVDGQFQRAARVLRACIIIVITLNYCASVPTVWRMNPAQLDRRHLAADPIDQLKLPTRRLALGAQHAHAWEVAALIECK